MKTKLLQLALLFFTTACIAQAQYSNWNSNAYQNDIDLQTVVAVFNSSKNISDFERSLNELNYQEFQLDLNQDNQIDFLRVVENGNQYNRYVLIQAIVGYNNFQDVATIEIQKNRFNNRLTINVVNNLNPSRVYQSEVNYYNTRPIYASFWLPNYRFYISASFWRNYPKYYRCVPYRNIEKCHRTAYNYSYYGNNHNYGYYKNEREERFEGRYRNEEKHEEKYNNAYNNKNENQRRNDNENSTINMPRYSPNERGNAPRVTNNTDIVVDKSINRNNISNRFLSETPAQNNPQNGNAGSATHINSRRF
jgi:hypothetical protein